MNDELELELELELALRGLRRTDITPPPLRVVASGARRRTRRRRTATTIVGVVILLGAMSAFGLVTDRDQSATVTSDDTATSTTANVRTTEPPATPDGFEAVVDGEGRSAGYISKAEIRFALDHGLPVLDIGTGRYETRGLTVVDLDGTVVGYYVNGDPGFVSLDEVADPQAADASGAAQQAQPQDQEQARDLLEQLED